MEKIKNNSCDNDATLLRLYSYIVSHGTSAFNKGEILAKYKHRDLLENMIVYFESAEEYEKCGFLKIILGNIGCTDDYELIANGTLFCESL